MIKAVILSGATEARSASVAESKDPDDVYAKIGLERHSHMDHQYWVYIVSSRTGTLYIGVTNNLERRMREHKSGEFEGFASEYHCNRLVYWESYDDIHKAIGREKQLKGWRRAKKIALIEAMNPRWEDLAEHWGAEMVFAGESIKGR